MSRLGQKVTLGAGVPTIWIAALPLIQSGKFELSAMQRIVCGGSAAPRSMIESYDKLGLNILHGPAIAAFVLQEDADLGPLQVLLAHQ